jgi:hypothetical protein
MKTITLLLATVASLTFSSCTCTKSGSCCSADSATATKACCKEAGAKGVACTTCAATKKAM